MSPKKKAVAPGSAAASAAKVYAPLQILEQ